MTAVRDMAAHSLPLPNMLKDALHGAARARAHGEHRHAVDILSKVMSSVLAEPFGVPFAARVQLALVLADTLFDIGDRPRARQLLLDEAGYCDQIVRLLAMNGTPDQRRSASAGRMQIRDRLAQIELIGRPAPELVVQDWVLGESASLADLRGRVILLEFWATWCRPCLELFPRLRELHARHAEQGLEIIALTRYGSVPSVSDSAVAQARERDLVQTVVAERGLQIRVGIAPDGRTQSQYGAHGVPTVVLIGRDGTVRTILSGGDEAELDARLLACLAEQAP